MLETLHDPDLETEARSGMTDPFLFPSTVLLEP